MIVSPSQFCLRLVVTPSSYFKSFSGIRKSPLSIQHFGSDFGLKLLAVHSLLSSQYLRQSSSVVAFANGSMSLAR